MDYVRGRSFWDQRLPGLEASEKKAIYAAMVSTLARLHRVDPAAVGLADLGRPDGYVSRTVERWTDRKSVVEGKSVAVRVDLGGRRSIKKNIRRQAVSNYTTDIQT